MSGFNELNTVINDILIKIISNQNLCKLLQYDTYSPLSESDIEDTSTLLFQKIYPFPFTPDDKKEASSVLNIIFDDLSSIDNVHKATKVQFVVLCHSDLWRIEGKLRPLTIMDEIQSMFHNLDGLGIGKLEFKGGSLMWVNSKYSGYKISYKLVDYQ